MSWIMILNSNNFYRADWDGQLIHGRPSPPHEVATKIGSDYIEVTWTPPTISNPEDYHKYRFVNPSLDCQYNLN